MNSNLLRGLALSLVLCAPLHAGPGEEGWGQRIKRTFLGDDGTPAGNDQEQSADSMPAASSSTGRVLNAPIIAMPDQGTLRAMIALSGFNVSQADMGKLLGLLSQAFHSGVSMQQLLALNKSLDAPLDGNLVQAVQVQLMAQQGHLNALGMAAAQHGTNINDLQRRTTAIDERANTTDARVHHNTQRIDELFHHNPLVAIGHFMGQWLQAENVNGFAEKVFGFAPFTLAFLPHTVAVLGGIEVATRMPVPFRGALRPLRSLMWLTFVLASIRASKTGVDNFQEWAQRVLGPRIARVTGDRRDAGRIATGSSALVLLAALLYMQRRGLLQPPFMRKHKRKN